jgi:hypothetical protein
MILLAAVALLWVGQSHAGTVTMTFHGLQNLEPIDNYYNGGTGGFGSGPGPNYGVAFTPDSLAIISAANGGSGNFTNAPGGDTIAFFLTGAGDTMNVAAGFNTGFSFFYSSPFYTGSVQVYSGPNGTGSLLANIVLPTTPNGSGQFGYPYSIWEPAGVSFAGTAESAVFSGVANYIGFSNITLGSATPTVPEPASLTLLGLGALGLVAYRLRRKQAV